jgi:16S rRNA G966 N2-methylase RsmD
MNTEKQQTLGLSAGEEKPGPVECLGQTFESDDARREHYLALLAEKLKDPEFRKTPGFPIGEDEDILRMSDPPYYTACPNPFLDDFVRVYGRPYDPDEDYSREPFAVDVSVGKTDQLYRAHSYHTKVPHLAIVPSILHYTNPGDIVLDGFCGSGMTGVAAQWCGTAPNDYRLKLEEEWKHAGREAPEWGARRAILGDLGPAASFIAANYNIPFDVEEFAEVAQRILDEVEEELGWMYETLHTDGKTKGRINYTVWSDVFSCPECSGEVVFVEEAMDKETKRVRDEFPCPSCETELTKKKLDRLYESRFDSATGDTIKTTRRRPVLINYSIGRSKFEKELDRCDTELLQRIESMPLPLGVPILQFPMDDMWEAPRLVGHGISHVHHMFLPRPAHSLAALWEKATAVTNRRLRNMLLFFVEQAIWGMSILNRYKTIMHGKTTSSNVNQYLSGVYYVPSQISEVSPKYNLQLRLGRLKKHAFSRPFSVVEGALVAVCDCAHIPAAADSIDYIFTDPPFGDNFPYSELNFSVEAWHKVVTAAAPEAVVERSKKNGDQKGVLEYQDLMRGCFVECHRVLKPGRWMTVVFSNSKNHVWRAIQEAMGTAGFVIADVRTLDKKQRSFKQVTSAAVKQDLIISAYKPTDTLTEQFQLGTAGEESVWAFISEHLGNVPVFVGKSGEAEMIVERTPQMLHDRMIAFFVQHGVAVPVSGPDFFVGLSERHPIRDGMYFLHDQVAEYDKKRSQVVKLVQLLLFVSDEASATRWIREQLRTKPQSFEDLQPLYMPQTQAWAKHEDTIDLKEILELNFLCYDGDGPVPSQIHSYLSTNFKDLRKLEKDDAALKDKAVNRWYVPDPDKEGDLEKLRLRTLLKEFEGYRTGTSKKIKQFRSEAVRAGFKHCYDEQDYQTIVDVAAKLPEKVIQEDEKLLMYYDVATMRLGS